MNAQAPALFRRKARRAELDMSEVLPAGYVADPLGYAASVKARIVNVESWKLKLVPEPPPTPKTRINDAIIYAAPIGPPTEQQVLSVMLNRWFVLSSPGVARVKISDILKAVARQYRVTVDDIKGPHRMSSIILPRQVAMFLIRHARPDASFPEIGRQIGGKDHTTVMHGERKVRRLLHSGDLIIPRELLDFCGITEQRLAEILAR